jgi:hypothetical protein
MPERDAALPCLLLIERDSAQRKLLRKSLEAAGHAVLAVNSMGEALARLRVHHYEMVLCTDRHNSATLAEDYGPLIDVSGLLCRSAVGFELYLPGIGIDARAILIVPTTDPQRALLAVRDSARRLERMSTAAPRALSLPAT